MFVLYETRQYAAVLAHPASGAPSGAATCGRCPRTCSSRPRSARSGGCPPAAGTMPARRGPALLGMSGLGPPVQVLPLGFGQLDPVRAGRRDAGTPHMPSSPLVTSASPVTPRQLVNDPPIGHGHAHGRPQPTSTRTSLQQTLSARARER